eukprot:9485379-Pyramimonas_sp.AAC.4
MGLHVMMCVGGVSARDMSPIGAAGGQQGGADRRGDTRHPDCMFCLHQAQSPNTAFVSTLL